MNPLVSIVLPTYNNESTIVRTLNSLMSQTLRDIEIIIVDDFSTDMTLSLCRDAERVDSRISLIPLDANRTVLQTRRIGVKHAVGTYVMFCDSDDELAPQAAEEASSFAQGGGYDVVHFSTTIVSATGSKHRAWERALDPFGAELFGQDILLSSSFGQPGATISGNIWNKLYDRRLVEDSWESIDPELRLPRAQDFYQTLLILPNATRYGGLRTPLYRYNFGAGKSGNVANRGAFQHFLASTLTYHAVKDYLVSSSWNLPSDLDSKELLGRLRDQFIENQLKYWFELPQPAEAALNDLLHQWDPGAVVGVLANRHPGKAQLITETINRWEIADLPFERSQQREDRLSHIALLGNIRGIGGVQKVMAVQADLLIRAGYSVTVLSFDHDTAQRMPQFPPGVMYRSLGPRGEVGTGVSELISAIHEGKFTALLNHENYSSLLPWIAVVTRILDVPSALFLHNFSLRGMLDFREVFGYLPTIARGHDMLVTLSDADRMWWEASGVPNVRLLPNFAPDFPASSEVWEAPTSDREQSPALLHDSPPPPIDLLWVGRLHDDTKNISGLLESFAQVLAQRPHTTLAIVGGEGSHGERARLERIAERLNVASQVLFAGPRHDVDAWYRSAKVFLGTSVIEGFNLTLVEAQGYGLPVVMYDLPYLETVNRNPGIIAVEWGASERLAQAAVGLLESPEHANQLGLAGRAFMQRFSLDHYDAQLKSIVSQLGTTRSPGTEAPPPETVSRTTTAVVPTSVIDELYRLYQRMHERMTSELRSVTRENTDYRRHISQLKHYLGESKAQHQRVQDVIAQIEKKKPASAPKKAGRPPRSSSAVGGVWPLWGRQGAQPFETPRSSPFEDVPPTAPVALPVAWALECGLLNATPGDRLNGDYRVTRHEFITMLYRLAGSPETTSGVVSYRDLDLNDPVANWATHREILKPTISRKADNVLPAWNPDSPLRRRATAMILYRAAGSPTYRAPHVSPYMDLAVGQKTFKEMCWAAHQGVLPAIRKKEGLMFGEQLFMTRTETLTALFRQMIGPVAMLNQE